MIGIILRLLRYLPAAVEFLKTLLDLRSLLSPRPACPVSVKAAVAEARSQQKTQPEAARMPEKAPEVPAEAFPPVTADGPYHGDTAAFAQDLEKLKHIAQTGES